ncbi:MAG: glycerophosphodiester phosphodiesterase [Bacteroidales bacterium]
MKQLDAGNGEKIPMLTESLHVINRKAKVNIELKGRNCATAVSDVVLDFTGNKGWEMDDFLISSFDHDQLFKIRKLLPTINIGVLFEGPAENFETVAGDLNAWSVNMDYNFVDKQKVDEVHYAGYKIYIYTVNSQADKQRMQDIGVDGIFTDYP